MGSMHNTYISHTCIHITTMTVIPRAWHAVVPYTYVVAMQNHLCYAPGICGHKEGLWQRFLTSTPSTIFESCLLYLNILFHNHRIITNRLHKEHLHVSGSMYHHNNITAVLWHHLNVVKSQGIKDQLPPFSCGVCRIIDLYIYVYIYIYICDRPREKRPYCVGPQSEIWAKIVA